MGLFYHKMKWDATKICWNGYYSRPGAAHSNGCFAKSPRPAISFLINIPSAFILYLKMSETGRPALETSQTTTIFNSIRQVYQKRLLPPAAYLLFLFLLWFVTPISELALPQHVSAEVPFRELSSGRTSYAAMTLTDLHFTGYAQKILWYTNGYYYYTFQDGKCILVLLAPATCGEGIPHIGRLHIRVRILRNFEDYDTLTQRLAADLEWTASGIRSQIPDYLLSEPGFHKLLSFLLLAIYFAGGAYALGNLLACLAFYLFPALSPPCRKLGKYGDAGKLLAQAEEEFISSREPVAFDMYLTKSFLISFSQAQAVIVPVREILWVYKHVRLRRFLWYPLPVSFTLHIWAGKRMHLSYPQMKEPEIDYLIEYLKNANGELLVGLREDHRRKVRDITKR